MTDGGQDAVHQRRCSDRRDVEDFDAAVVIAVRDAVGADDPATAGICMQPARRRANHGPTRRTWYLSMIPGLRTRDLDGICMC